MATTTTTGTEPLYDFTVVRGNTFPIALDWTDEDGDAIDLTGFSATFAVVSAAGAALLTLTSAADRITLGDAAGTIALELTASETEALTADAAPDRQPVRCPFELRVADGGGSKETVLKGRLFVTYSPIEG